MGKQIYSYYEGSRSEFLAQFLLSKICFVVPVPTKSDVGVDFFCTLFSQESGDKNSYLVPGSTFALQVKSKGNDIILSSDNFNYIQGLEIPYFLAIVDKISGQVDIYSCQQFSHLSLKYGNLNQEAKGKEFQITLNPVPEYSQKNINENLNNLIGQHIEFSKLLKKKNGAIDKKVNKKGEKIINLKLDIGPKVLKLDNTKESDSELTKFVELDYTNLYNRKNYIPYPVMALYTDEKKLEFKRERHYYHPENSDSAVFVKLVPRLVMLLEHYEQLGRLDISKKPELQNSKNELELLIKSADIKKLIKLVIKKSKSPKLPALDLKLHNSLVKDLEFFIKESESK